jgi:glutathione S-transferase
MLELYNAPISTCSQKVRLVLAEKALPFVDRRLRFEDGDHLSPTYLAMNPNGVVPTLVHDGHVITDSSVINEYLEEAFHDDLALLPRDPVDRAHMRAWRQFIDEVPTVAIRAPSFNAFLVSRFAGWTDEAFQRYTSELPLRKHFYRRMGRNGFSNADIQMSMDQLTVTLQRVAAATSSAPYLCGERPTLADFSLLPTFVRMEDLGLADMWDDLPKAAAWFDRMQSRPSFATAFYPGSRELSPSC